MTIGDRIKKQRMFIDMSQTELAEKIGVKKQTLYKYENNVVTNIPSDVIEKICKVIKVSPAYLMGWSDNLTVVEADLIPELLSNTELLDIVKKLIALNKEHKQTIFDNISYWYEKEGH
nr:MAG TPA: helix-turn-helix domain protein [Caudoviricetes sp.]